MATLARCWSPSQVPEHALQACHLRDQSVPPESTGYQLWHSPPTSSETIQLIIVETNWISIPNERRVCFVSEATGHMEARHGLQKGMRWASATLDGNTMKSFRYRPWILWGHWIDWLIDWWSISMEVESPKFNCHVLDAFISCADKTVQIV